jgi:5-formyltetrahydrofolate cyclo-ligase
MRKKSTKPQLVWGLTKQQIRSKILLKLNSQKEEDREQKTKIIKEKLFKLRDFNEAKVVMFYIAFGGEVETKEMIKEARRLGKIIAVPICKKDRISIRPCILDENARLKRGIYAVFQPMIEKTLHLEDLDLVIVPGIAFDKKGNRLGRGKGCYDNFLKKIPKDTPTIGLAFDFQILPNLPTQTQDVSVKKILFA